MLTAAKVGAALGLSTRKIYDLAATGALACYRFGGAVRFDEADVEAFKASCKVARSKVVAPLPRLSGSRLVSETDGTSVLDRAFRRAGVTLPKARPSHRR